MIDPGRLKTRLVIEAPVDAPDGQGGVTRTYAPQTTVWAALSAQSAHAGVQADAVGAALRVRVILRGHLQLTLQHRLNDNGEIYRILGLTPRDDGRFIEIDAEAWQR